jgi:hypothetical protein
MQSKKEMRLVSGINNPDEKQCKEATSETESPRSLKELLDSIGEPAEQAPPSGGIYFNLLREDELRASHAEILELLREAVVSTEGPDATPLSSDEASLLHDAKASVNSTNRNIDLLLEQIPHLALRNALWVEFNDALLYGYILGNYSERSWSMREWFEKIAKKRAAMLNAKRSAIVRKEEAAEGWHPSAKKLAKQKRAEDKNASKAGVARHIRDNWPLKYRLPGDDRALVRLVSDMERKGELAPRAKKNRT